MGEATSDFFVHHYSPVLAVLCAGVVFALVLYLQLSMPSYQTAIYWWSVVMVSVFGTMCADVVHVALGVPYLVSAIGFATALCVVFYSWSRFEHTLSIHGISTTRRELFYWLTVTVTFALGTAVGDLTAYSAHLGFLRSGLLFALLISLPAIGFFLLHMNAIGTFWAAYILTRPLGASFADWIGVSHVRGGLNWGPGTVSLLLSALILIGVAADVVRERPVRSS
jgi:uncharacterized membrane-anchored protein